MEKEISNKTPCLMAHTIEGIIPNFADCEGAKQYDGKECDCGKLKAVTEYCGCPDCPENTKFIEND